MNKKSIITILLAFIAIAGQAQVKCHVEGKIMTDKYGDDVVVCKDGTDLRVNDDPSLHYKATVDALAKSYEAVVSAMAARHPSEDILLTADGDLTPFGQRLFTQMTNAYQGKLSTADHELAERIRLFVRAVSASVNKRTYDTMLTTLRKMTKRGNRHGRGRKTIKQSINILTLQQK